MPRPTLPEGHALQTFAEIDSTNAEALRQAGREVTGPAWFVADRQTSGRGRQGRAWSSPAGNLHATLLLGIEGALRQTTELAFLAALAVHATAARLIGDPDPSPRLALKWPNDLLLEGAKVAGILIETVWTNRLAPRAVAIGFGLNLACHPVAMSYPATHLGLHGATAGRDEALEELARQWDCWHRTWIDKGFDPIREAWLARAQGIGSTVAVTLPEGPVHGVFTGIEQDGALVLSMTDGKRRRILAGDLFLNQRAPLVAAAKVSGP